MLIKRKQWRGRRGWKRSFLPPAAVLFIYLHFQIPLIPDFPSSTRRYNPSRRHVWRCANALADAHDAPSEGHMRQLTKKFPRALWYIGWTLKDMVDGGGVQLSDKIQAVHIGACLSLLDCVLMTISYVCTWIDLIVHIKQHPIPSRCIVDLHTFIQSNKSKF